MHEVADIGPVVFIAGVELDRRARLSPITSSQIRADLGRATARPDAGVVEAGLEAVEGDLAHHRVEPILDLAGQKGAPIGALASASRRSNTRPSPKIEAVSAKVSGVSASKVPCGAARVWCAAWPSSCARVSTSRRSPMKLRET